MRVPVKAVAGFIVYSLLTPASLLIAGGDSTWGISWAYSILSIAAIVGSRIAALKRSPDLLYERARSLEAKDAQVWDRVMVLMVGMLSPLAINITAGLDHRFGWSANLPLFLQLAALLCVALGYLLGIWAMLENLYFSAVVRIQSERGHQVVSSGPYAVVRHPAYAGGVVASLAAPVALGGFWALVPAALSAILLVVRTELEDRTLRRALPGYEQYVSRVRFRLVPGLW